jgi:hypothetical protein
VCVHGGSANREPLWSGRLAPDGVWSRDSGVETAADRGGLAAARSESLHKGRPLSPAPGLNRLRPSPTQHPFNGLSLIGATARNRMGQPQAEGPPVGATLPTVHLLMLVPEPGTAAARPYSLQCILQCVWPTWRRVAGHAICIQYSEDDYAARENCRRSSLIVLQ